MKKIIFLGLIFGGLFSANFFINSSLKAQEPNKVRLYFFHTSTCPHCKEEGKFLEKIKKEYPTLEIQSFLLDEEKNVSIFKKVINKYNLSGGVPVTIIGEEVIVGFNNEFGIGKEIKKEIEKCFDKNCESFLDEELGLAPLTGGAVNTNNNQEEEKDHDSHKTIQVFGKEICLEEDNSLCFLGGFLGLADGINPCMFSVLMFLLVYLMGIGSSRKAFKAGIAFVITTFFFYLIFMYGLIRIIDILEISQEVRAVVALFAFLAGLVMIKDYFFYGRWFSFEISEKFKPFLERMTKKGTVLSAIVLALAASLVELPCTSGIPLAYVSILSDQEVFVLGYLMLYNFFFILPLLVIVLGTIFVWKKVEKIEEFKERGKKYMRLVAGILLVFLALAIWNNWL